MVYSNSCQQESSFFVNDFVAEETDITAWYENHTANVKVTVRPTTEICPVKKTLHILICKILKKYICIGQCLIQTVH